MFIGRLHQESERQQKYVIQGEDDDDTSDRRSSAVFDIEDGAIASDPKPLRAGSDAKYLFHRDRTERWGRWIMFVGYALIVVNCIALALTTLGLMGLIHHKNAIEDHQKANEKIAEIENSTEPKKQKIADEINLDNKLREARYKELVYSPKQEHIDDIFKILEELFQILQGWLMIKASRDVLYKIKKQRENANAMKKKFLQIVQDYNNYIWALIILIILLRGARSFYMYAVVDRFLREEYKDAAKYWKMANQQAATNALINQKMISSEAEAKEYFDQMEKFWYEYGPISSVMLIIATVSCCSTILCCMNRFRTNLEEYEESPFNPHNGNNI